MDKEELKARHGIYGDSLFFAGFGKYFLNNTCNTWED
jgi:hypothetical protein